MTKGDTHHPPLPQHAHACICPSPHATSFLAISHLKLSESQRRYELLLGSGNPFLRVVWSSASMSCLVGTSTPVLFSRKLAEISTRVPSLPLSFPSLPYFLPIYLLFKAASFYIAWAARISLASFLSPPSSGIRVCSTAPYLDTCFFTGVPASILLG